MSDVKLAWANLSGAADFSVTANDLVREFGWETAVIISLFSKRRIADSDELPTGVTERGGWWADEFAKVPGDKIGSRLWLLERAPRSQNTLDLVEEYSSEGLEWFVEDGAATSVSCVASFLGTQGWALDVQIFRPQSDPVLFRFDDTWLAQEGS